MYDIEHSVHYEGGFVHQSVRDDADFIESRVLQSVRAVSDTNIPSESRIRAQLANV